MLAAGLLGVAGTACVVSLNLALTGEAIVKTAEGVTDAGLAAMTKNTATDMCSWVVDQAVQIHGGYGYMREYEVERAYRDMRLNRIGAGTDEIMLDVIGRSYGI